MFMLGTKVLEEFLEFVYFDTEDDRSVDENTVWVNKEIFHRLQDKAKNVVQLIGNTNTKIYDSIIPSIMNKRTLGTVENIIRTEYEVVLHEKNTLEVEIINLILNNSISPYIHRHILNDSELINQIELKESIRNKSIEDVINIITGDSSKTNGNSFYVFELSSFIKMIIMITGEDYTVLIKENGNISNYNCKTTDEVIDRLKLSLGYNINNIFDIHKYILNKETTYKFINENNYLKKFLVYSTLFKI